MKLMDHGSDMRQGFVSKTYISVQPQFACNLHTGEDSEGEFHFQFLKHKVLAGAGRARYSTAGSVGGERVFKMLHHEPMDMVGL